MSAWRVLPAADRLAVPWKNGGGVTREIVVHPAVGSGAGDGAFEWRISMAEVATAGPFSCFDGIDRTLMVLSGMLRLDLADGSRHLGPGQIIAFGGEVPVWGAPLESVVIDLNVMVRRGLWRASVQRFLPPIDGMELPRGAGTIVLVGGAATAQGGGRLIDLLPQDAIELGVDQDPVTITSAHAIYVVRFDRTGLDPGRNGG